MADLMHIVDKLREAAAQAKRECDGQVEQALSRMSKKIKDDITSHRDNQLQRRKQMLEHEEQEHLTQKKQLENNLKQFEKLKRGLIELLETHKVKQKELTQPQEFDERIGQLQVKHSRMKAKHGGLLAKLSKPAADKMAATEMADLCNKLNKKLAQKMNHCKCLMLRDDETLVKIHHMLTGHES
ncbi:uncharacterized protein BcabD6B2_03260 [Babesia caballi]|uniref:Uncharacterized protein n=1 Tax=Babesia caballi TaxID=5871 RepID=A0AAV4LM53_BABCB|nr:hypothetical protein, conserved [Babesia caballi]